MFRFSSKILLLVFLCFIKQVAAEKIVLSFDDAPIGNGPFFSIDERHEKMLACLKEKQVKAIFFVIPKQSEQFEKDYKSFYFFKDHYLANHSYSHQHLSEMKAEDYLQDVLKADQILSRFPNYKKCFRYPFLDYGQRKNTGGSTAKAKAVASRLHTLGFSHGYVSLDVFDWFLQSLVEKAVKAEKTISFENLKDFYLKLIRSSIEQAPKQKEAQMLLLHANDINALFIADIIEEFKAHEWQWIDPMEAYQEPHLLNNFLLYKKQFTKKILNLKKFSNKIEEITNAFEDAGIAS